MDGRDAVRFGIRPTVEVTEQGVCSKQRTFVEYVDEDGASRFEDLVVNLLPVDFAPPAAPLNMAQSFPATRSLWVGGLPDWSGGAPHPSRQRQVFCMLRGECEVTASDGAVRRSPVGSVLCLDDTWGHGHFTRVTSPEEVLFFTVVVTDAASPDV